MIEESNVKITKTKHLGLIILLFFGGVSVIVTFVVLYAFGLFTSSSGYMEVEAIADETVAYRGYVHCYLYFSGNDMAVRTGKNEAARYYSEALKKAYKLIDAEKVYEDSYSLGRINAEPNAEVAIGEELSAILKQAYELSSRENNYSIFAGPVYGVWKTLANAHTTTVSEEFDPAVDGEIAAMLGRLSDYAFDASHIDLHFLDGGKVKLSVSEEYLTYLKESQITGPLLSLNALAEVYQAKAAATAMEEHGYRDGYLVTERGYGLTLSGLPGMAHSFFTPDTLAKGASARVQYAGVHCFAKCSRFRISGLAAINCYTILVDGKKIYRSPFVDLEDGIARDDCLSVNLFAPGNDLYALAIEAERGSAIHGDALPTYIGTLRSDTDYVFLKKEEPTIFYHKQSLTDSLTVLQSGTITLKTI